MKGLWQHLRRLVSGSRTVPTLSSPAAYAQWATTYAPQAHNPLMEAEQRAMQRLKPRVHGRMVLDLACGTGRWGNWAQSQGAQRVIGVDNSFEMLAAGVLTYVVQAHMDAIPLPHASIDVVLCGLATGHLPPERLQQALQAIAHVLVAGGAAYISDFHPFLAWQGAQRTFQTVEGQTLAVEHYRHSYADYFRYGVAAGLVLSGVEEAFAADSSTPLVLALCLTKPA